MTSWIESANTSDTPFPVANLPYGSFSYEGVEPRPGIALGNLVADLRRLESEGLLKATGHRDLFGCEGIDRLLAAGPKVWEDIRSQLVDLFRTNGRPALRENVDLCAAVLHDTNTVRLHMPFEVREFTDFNASVHHARNVARIFRGPDAGLSPQWMHLPVAYNGRASSIVVSGTEIQRPVGQFRREGTDQPVFAPTEALDFELELGAVIGKGNDWGRPVDACAADSMIFGYVLLNDWSARDVQQWEAHPLGPFQSKAFATSISPWVVTTAALEGARVPVEHSGVDRFEYLKEDKPGLYDLELVVEVIPFYSGIATTVCRSNYRHMSYSSAQQIAHHTSGGCNMRPGDLIGSGTISGPDHDSFGALLELTDRGRRPILLNDGSERRFLEDKDIVRISGMARTSNGKIGFGTCEGLINPFP